MSLREDWDEHYTTGFLPWDTGRPDPLLVELIEGSRAAGGRVLEVGCGTGTNAVWLATKGWAVVGVDLAPHAIVRAQARAAEAGVAVDFRAVEFLTEPLVAEPFDLVFDRGCLHVFDAAADRERFAARVAELLAPGGRWLSLVGSTEGPPRDSGPPRRSARDLAAAIEPHLEIVELRRAPMEAPVGEVMGWWCLAERRSAPAQPSSVHRAR